MWYRATTAGTVLALVLREMSCARQKWNSVTHAKNNMLSYLKQLHNEGKFATFRSSYLGHKNFFLTRCHFLPIKPIALKFLGDILESYPLLISLFKSVQIFSKRNNNFLNNKKSESPIFIFNDKSCVTNFRFLII